MAIGIAASPVANAMLDLFGNASQTGWSTPYLKLHTGDPGSAGATAASSVTTRVAVTFSAASAGSKSATGSPVAQWASWAGTNNEVVTHLSVWTASSAGTFLGSIALSASKTMATGDTLNITALTLSISTLAA